MKTHVKIPAGAAVLAADLAVPDEAAGAVIFVHGSGSGRVSPRNRFVAAMLQDRHLATILIDFLTPDEENVESRGDGAPIDVDMLASRVARVVEWLRKEESTAKLGIGLFGASTGAAAALSAAAHHPDLVHAVVCRGGRPDLATSALPRVHAPTLLIVGGLDHPVIRLNQQAMGALRCEKRFEMIPGAGHLFEQEGALELVGNLAAQWYAAHLAPAGQPLPLVMA